MSAKLLLKQQLVLQFPGIPMEPFDKYSRSEDKKHEDKKHDDSKLKA